MGRQIPPSRQGLGMPPMKTFLLLPRALAAAAALVLGAPAAAQSPASPPAAAGQAAATAGVAEAKALVNEGRFLDALRVLRPLAEAHDPVPPDVLFLIGLAGIEASQRPGLPDKARDALLDASVQALRTMLIRDPGLVRARLELARAFFLQRKDSLARRNFEQVLAGDLPPAGGGERAALPARDPRPAALEHVLRGRPHP